MIRRRALFALGALGLLAGSARAAGPPIRVGIAPATPQLARDRATARLLRRIANAGNRPIQSLHDDVPMLLAALRAGKLDVVIAPADSVAAGPRSAAFDSALGPHPRAAFTRGDDPRFSSMVDREAQRTARIVR